MVILLVRDKVMLVVSPLRRGCGGVSGDSCL